MLTHIRQLNSDERMKRFLEDGINKKTTKGFENFVKEYARIINTKDRWTAVGKWTNYMSLDDLYQQIALTYEYEGNVMKWLNSVVSHDHIHSILIELKKHFEMMVIQKIL